MRPPADWSGLAARLPRLVLGLVLCGVGLAFMVAADLGLNPWEVLHQGISDHTGVPIGRAGIVVGFVVLLAWAPLRLRPGLGTLCNVVVIGLVIDAVLALVPAPGPLAARVAAMVGGVGLVGLGSGLYIGAGLGAGPRDGLMTGLAERGVGSVRTVRTAIELAALVGGWALGGTVGIGTLVFALAIGPLVQVALVRLTVPALALAGEAPSSVLEVDDHHEPACA